MSKDHHKTTISKTPRRSAIGSRTVLQQAGLLIRREVGASGHKYIIGGRESDVPKHDELRILFNSSAGMIASTDEN